VVAPGTSALPGSVAIYTLVTLLIPAPCGEGGGAVNVHISLQEFCPGGGCYVYASSLQSPQVIYAPVIMFSMHFLTLGVMSCNPYSIHVRMIFLSGCFASKIFSHPAFLLHAILSCPILKICKLIPPTKWSHQK
jgi:hypothetical protein